MAKVWNSGDQVLAADLNMMVVPCGGVVAYAGASIPANWLICNGAAVSRTTYANLFTAIGTTYGSGDGSTTFNVPDMRGNVIAGYKASDANFGTLGAAVGEATHLLTTTEMPSHRHGLDETGSGGGGTFIGMQSANGAVGNGNTDYAGGGTAHNNIQPSLTMNFIIRY